MSGTILLLNGAIAADVAKSHNVDVLSFNETDDPNEVLQQLFEYLQDKEVRAYSITKETHAVLKDTGLIDDEYDDTLSIKACKSYQVITNPINGHTVTIQYGFKAIEEMVKKLPPISAAITVEPEFVPVPMPEDNDSGKPDEAETLPESAADYSGDDYLDDDDSEEEVSDEDDSDNDGLVAAAKGRAVEENVLQKTEDKDSEKAEVEAKRLQEAAATKLPEDDIVVSGDDSNEDVSDDENSDEDDLTAESVLEDSESKKAEAVRAQEEQARRQQAEEDATRLQEEEAVAKLREEGAMRLKEEEARKAQETEAEVAVEEDDDDSMRVLAGEKGKSVVKGESAGNGASVEEQWEQEAEVTEEKGNEEESKRMSAKEKEKLVVTAIAAKNYGELDGIFQQDLPASLEERKKAYLVKVFAYFNNDEDKTQQAEALIFIEGLLANTDHFLLNGQGNNNSEKDPASLIMLMRFFGTYFINTRAVIGAFLAANDLQKGDADFLTNIPSASSAVAAIKPLQLHSDESMVIQYNGVKKSLNSFGSIGGTLQYMKRVTRQGEIQLSFLWKYHNNAPLQPRTYRDLDNAFKAGVKSKQEYIDNVLSYFNKKNHPSATEAGGKQAQARLQQEAYHFVQGLLNTSANYCRNPRSTSFFCITFQSLMAKQGSGLTRSFCELLKFFADDATFGSFVVKGTTSADDRALSKLITTYLDTQVQSFATIAGKDPNKYLRDSCSYIGAVQSTSIERNSDGQYQVVKRAP